MAIFMWCPHCNNETKAVSSIASWQAAQRVAAMQIAMEGYDGGTPSYAEVQQWATQYSLDFPVVIDGQGAQLGHYFDVSAVPVNIVVDPRTMGVLSVDIGEIDDVQGYEQSFLP
jgi:hypothetical protein